MNDTASNDYLRRVVHAICFGGASTLTLSGLSAPSNAAGAAAGPAAGSTNAVDSELTEITVTGYRASIQQSLDIKRDSDGIIDAISAEDIGKFPDSNLATAMERIPGVTVSRGSVGLGGGGVGTSTGAATQITVRGFGPSFNETLYDGRQVPTAIGHVSRGFDFNAVGSDFVNQVDIMKTPDSTLSSGAIGATVNIKYPKPFDHPGMQLAGSASGSDSTGENKVTPNVSLLFSDTFADDRFGVLIDGAYADSKVRGNHINVQGWEGGRGDGSSGLAPCQFPGAAPCAYAPGPPPKGVTADPSATPNVKDWFIQDFGIYQEHTEDKRVGGRFVLQAKPVDGLVLTLDDNYAKETITQQQQGFSVWFNGNGLRDVVQAPDGTVTSFIAPGSNSDFQAAFNGSVIQTNTVGFNVKWDATDHTSYMFDAYSAVSKLNPGGQLSERDADVGYGNSPGHTNSMGVVITGGNNLPYLVGYGPGGDASRFLDTSIIGSHVLVEDYNQNKNTINQFKLEGSWKDEQVKLKYGVQFTHDGEELRQYTDLPYTWQMYAGYGPPPNGSGGVVPIPLNLISGTFSTGSNFIHGWGNGGNLPPAILAANANAIFNYLQGLNGVGMNGAADTKTCSNLSGGTPCTGKYIMYENLNNHQDISENTVAPYFSLSTTTKIADLPLKINLGARYEDTHTDSAGVSALPTGQLYILPTDLTAYGYSTAPPAPIRTKSEYRYLLPSIDLNLGLTDTVKLRFDASRTLTRAPLNDLTPDLSVAAGQRVGALNATGGNPTLLPFLSDNLDFGAEWYYAPNSYLSVDGFVKEVTNFVVGGTISQAINGVTLPSGAPAYFSVTSQVNGPSAEVRGLEVSLQHVFGDTGFGFQVNGTFVSTNKPYDPAGTLSGFAVTGLANSANFVPFYDKYGFQARVAINHRSEYLDIFGQRQNNSQFGTEPTFVNAATYVDFSTSYEINRHFNVYFEALNLTDQAYSTHGRFKEQVLDVVDNGRQFTLGVHAKL
jgi:iron complex outermembrane receptor protein